LEADARTPARTPPPIYVNDRTELSTNEAEARKLRQDPLKKYYVYGRPSIPALMKEALREAHYLETVAVGACGPLGWVNEVRKVVAESIESHGPSVSVFCEEFG
jgi:hypothetical protein